MDALFKKFLVLYVKLWTKKIILNIGYGRDYDLGIGTRDLEFS